MPPKTISGNHVRTCPRSLLVWILCISFPCEPGQVDLRFGELMRAWGLTSQRDCSCGVQAEPEPQIVLGSLVRR